MNNSGPAAAVLNLPGLAKTLVAAGFNVVGDALADTKTTIELLRTVQKKHEPFIIVVAIDDPALRSWATLHAAMGVPVLVARSEIFTNGDGIPQSRIVDLPCTVNEIMSNFGAPPDADYGEVVIGVDGTLSTDAPHPSDEDSFSVFAETVRESTTPGAQADTVISDDVFAQTSPQSSIDVRDEGAPAVNIFSSDKPSRAEDIFAAAAPKATAEVVDQRPDQTHIFSPEPDIPTAPISPRMIVRDPQVVPPRRTDVADAVFARPRHAPSAHDRRGTVVCVFAGKGGVGKSTTTIALAERAATVVPGMRVVAIDANRGQGDMRTFLKLDDAALPSIYDAAISRNVDVFRDVLINPTRLAGHRAGHQSLHVGVILSPAKDQSDPTVVSSQIYAQAIEYARSRADLVFVDTQIAESFDTSGLIDDVIVPLLLNDGWGLGLSDSSTPGVQNLMWVLDSFVGRGASTNRLMVALNRVAPSSLINASAMSQYVERFATWMGAVETDPLIERALNLGEVPGSSNTESTPQFTSLLDRVLFHVTGISTFSQILPNAIPTKHRSNFSFLLRRRR